MDCLVSDLNYKFVYVDDGPEPTQCVNLKILDRDCNERSHVFNRQKIEDLYVLICDIRNDFDNDEIDIDQDILNLI